MYPTVSIARVLENEVLGNYDPIQSELAENPTLRELTGVRQAVAKTKMPMLRTSMQRTSRRVP